MRILQCQALHEELVELRHLLYGSSHHTGSLVGENTKPLADIRVKKREAILLHIHLFICLLIPLVVLVEARLALTVDNVVSCSIELLQAIHRNW